jgi:hypothetical protein
MTKDEADAALASLSSQDLERAMDEYKEKFLTPLEVT